MRGNADKDSIMIRVSGKCFPWPMAYGHISVIPLTRNSRGANEKNDGLLGKTALGESSELSPRPYKRMFNSNLILPNSATTYKRIYSSSVNAHCRRLVLRGGLRNG